jgi:uncharacterized Zn finger protein (UPF0148 family)
MAKGKTFAAKLAHELTTQGKVFCPVCNTEIKRVKLIIAKKSKADSWAPKYQFKKVCKCNESDIMAGKY